MKIKTFLIAVMAFLYVTMTSCNDGKYAEAFVGDYDLEISPMLKINGEQDMSITSFKDVSCLIEKCINSKNGLHIYIGPTNMNLNFIANCDEFGMSIYEGRFNGELNTLEYGKIKLNITSSVVPHIDAPVNGYLSWQTPISGEVEYYMENDTIMTKSEVSGYVDFSGINIEYKDENR